MAGEWICEAGGRGVGGLGSLGAGRGPGPLPRALPALTGGSPQLSMLRISPSMGHTLDVSLALRHLLFLLEYCMVTGYDWWDTLLHVQPAMVQSLVEKLHEEYTRQNAALQQVAPLWPPLGAREPRPLGPGSPAPQPCSVQSPLWALGAGGDGPAPRGCPSTLLWRKPLRGPLGEGVGVSLPASCSHLPPPRPHPGAVHPDPGHEGLTVQAVPLHGGPCV